MEAMEHISRGLEWVGVAVIVAAFLLSIVYAIGDARAGKPGAEIYKGLRAFFGRGILLGLEVLVAADLIRTVAVDPTLENVGVLGLIVVVRTILSFSLDIEITGTLPWRKAAAAESKSPDTPRD